MYFTNAVFCVYIHPMLLTIHVGIKMVTITPTKGTAALALWARAMAAQVEGWLFEP